MTILVWNYCYSANIVDANYCHSILQLFSVHRLASFVLIRGKQSVLTYIICGKK